MFISLFCGIIYFMSSPALTEHLSQAMAAFPAEGIAYRGDAVANATRSLQRASANYIVFLPTPNSDIEHLATELQEGVEFALQFTYPTAWGENPRNPIPGVFSGYGNHYAQNPHDLPAISWGVASSHGQLAAVKRHGRGFYTQNSFITVGSVEREGPVNEGNIEPIITATLEDIQNLEASIALPENEVTVRSLSNLIRAKQRRPLSRAEYLGGTGRPDFHARLGELMVHKLLDSVEATLL